MRLCILAHKEDSGPALRQPWLRAGASDVAVLDLDSLPELLVASGARPDLVVLRASDAELTTRLRQIQAASSAIPVAVWSPEPTVRGAVQALRAGANTVELTARLDRELDALQKELPAGIAERLAHDLPAAGATGERVRLGGDSRPIE